MPEHCYSATNLLIIRHSFTVEFKYLIVIICEFQIVNKTGRRNTTMAITSVCGLAGILVNVVPNAIGSAVLCVVFSMGIVVLGFYTAMSVALFPTNLR